MNFVLPGGKNKGETRDWKILIKDKKLKPDRDERSLISWMFFLIAALLFLNPSAVLAGQEEGAKPGSYLILTGEVRTVQGEPVSDAEIHIDVDGKPYRKKGEREEGFLTSNMGGFFASIPFPGPEPGEVKLSIFKSSFRRISEFKVESFHPIDPSPEGTPRLLFENNFVLERFHGPAFYISGIVLLLVYLLIAIETFHRTLAALLGAVLLLFLTYSLGEFFPDFQIVSFSEAVRAVDLNVIFLLLGMMIIVGIMKRTGIFQWMAYKSFVLSGGRIYLLAAILMAVTAVVSAFLDNVTTMLLLTPVTIEISLALKLNPVVLLLPEILASNMGGTATLIGDPPNIMIGSYAGLSFNDFLVNLTPIIIVVTILHILMMKFFYGKEYSAIHPDHVENLIVRLKDEYKITDGKLLTTSLVVLGLVIFMFLVHGLLHMEPCIPALAGAAVLLAISGVKITDTLEKEVEWSTLVFFIMLFIIVGACEQTGIIQVIADGVKNLSGGNMVLTVLLILWISGIASAIIDNIPFTATMLPVVGFLIQGVPEGQGVILWWALSLGACLGGNGTLVGASANIVTAGLSEKVGHPISFMYFMKIGIPVTLMSLIVCSIWLLVWMR